MRTTASPTVDGGAIYAAWEILEPSKTAPIKAITKTIRFHIVNKFVVKDIIYLTFYIPFNFLDYHQWQHSFLLLFS